MRVIRTDDPGHPLLADFLALNDPAARREVERAGDYFVVEGALALERLLGLPEWQIRSIALISRMAERLAPQLAAVDAPVVVAPEAVLSQVAGFAIHRGVLASVQRRPPASLTEVIAPGQRSLLVVAEGVNDHENLGALHRSAAAFAAAAVALDPTCADPFYRRSVRVSLGHVLAVPTVALPALPGALDDLRELGATTVALTPSARLDLADVSLEHLGDGPVAVLVGAEGPGLSTAAIDAADLRVGIDMAAGVDSLNVATAAAIALFHLRDVLKRHPNGYSGP